MKHVFLIHEHHPRLLLFFAGWGADETPFRSYRPAECDLLLCYDYRTLTLDKTPGMSPCNTPQEEWVNLLTEYREVHIMGWSMGVWAASKLMPHLPVKPLTATAINGTPYPIDPQRGIPPHIYQGTLQGLTDQSLHKFLRRMCGTTDAFRSFLAVTPRRPLEELRQELADIGQQDNDAPCHPEGLWTEAVVGMNDLIIPAANQLEAWQSLSVPIRRTDDAHYSQALFQHYLQDRWTNN